MLTPKDFDFKNTLLVTHKGCNGGDGATCAILFLAYGGRKENIKFVVPDYSMDPFIEDPRQIIFADVGTSVAEAKKISHRNDIVFLDHHKTSIPLNVFDWCEIDEENTRCGARMLYDWLYQDDFERMIPYRQLVDLIDDYDRWQWKLKDTENLHIIYEMLGQDEFIDRFASGFFGFDIKEAVLIDNFKKQRQRYVDRKLKATYVKDINGYKYGFTISDQFTDQVGHQMIAKHGVDFAVMITPVSVSVRTKDGVDASKFAQLNGGGGHAGAAGIGIEKVLDCSLIELFIDKLIFVGD